MLCSTQTFKPSLTKLKATFSGWRHIQGYLLA